MKPSEDLTSSSPLASKARHDVSNFSKVHSACHIDTERASIDIDIPHSDCDLMVSSHYWLVRNRVCPVFVVYYVGYTEGRCNWFEGQRLILRSSLLACLVIY